MANYKPRNAQPRHDRAAGVAIEPSFGWTVDDICGSAAKHGKIEEGDWR